MDTSLFYETTQQPKLAGCQVSNLLPCLLLPCLLLPMPLPALLLPCLLLRGC